jgi:UDP-glucose 4-epimerase
LLLDVAAGSAEAFTVFGDDYPTPDGTCIRDYIHVADLADAHVCALRELLRGGASAALNIGTGRGWSVRELIEIARRVSGRDIAIRVGARRPGDPPALVSDPALAQARLGWSPRHPDVADQIAHAWAWRQDGRRGFKRAQPAPAR